MSNLNKEIYWREKFNNYKSSGLSATAWCKLNKIPSSTFHKWKMKFNNSDSAIDDNKWIEVKVTPEIIPTQNNPLTIVIGNATIEITDNFNDNTLKRVLSVFNKVTTNL